MKQLIKLSLAVVLYLICQNPSFAKKLPRFSQKMYDSIMVDSSLVICNDLLTIGNPPSDTSWRNGYSINKSKGFIILGLKTKDNLCLPTPMVFTVQLHIKYWNQNSILKTIDTSLTVTYNNLNSNSYKEQAVYVLDSASYIDITVISISNNSIKKYFYLEGQIEEDRYFTGFTPSYTPTFNLNYYSNSDEIEIIITDSLLNKIEEYDLEYTFVSGYNNISLSSVLATSLAEFNFKNGSTRVIIKGGSYRISNIFDKGYLVIRLRSIIYGGYNFTHRVNGNWSLPENGVCSDYLTSLIAINSSSFAKPHEPTLGWQLITEFAEDNRKKEIITYFDGTQRNRQTVTRNFTDSTSIVGETIYDFEGRPAINVLPAPTFENKIKYFSNFNVNRNDQKYSFLDFEQESICEATTDSMKVTSGASKYYSTKNPFTNFNTAKSVSLPNQMDFVPIANGYPFSQTVFLNDNSGRVKKQGGVGINHQIGSNHETFYFYGIPFQEELDRLFGTEVGSFNHYKKNMVIDPNGQVSVNYLNASGKTIATALSATSPENVSSLSSNAGRNGVIVNLKSKGDTIISKEAIIISRSFTVDEDGKEHKLFYSLIPEKYFPTCNPRAVCYDCIYDLEINLVNDDCGNILIKGGGDTLKVLKRTISNSIPDTICDESQFYSINTDSRLLKGSVENPSDTFVVINLPRGSYTLTKILTVNQNAYNTYLEDYLTNRICKTKEDFLKEAISLMDTIGCNFNCQTCENILGTDSSFLNNRILELLSSGYTVLATDTIEILEQYELNLESCAKLCLNENPSLCEGIFDVLKMDLSPGGQYAQYIYNETLEVYEANSNSHNILLEGNDIGYYYKDDTFFVNRSALIDGVLVQYSEMTVNEFVKNWKIEFADHLAYLHPEYCKYQTCLLNESSLWFDERMSRIETYEAAIDSNMLNPINTEQLNSYDPFFGVGGQGFNEWETMNSKMNNFFTELSNDTLYSYSMWETPVSLMFCSESVNAFERRNCVTQFTDTVFHCEIYKNTAWQYFKSFYYSAKQQLQDSLTKVNGCSDAVVPEGYIERFPYATTNGVNSETDVETLKAEILSQVIDTCYTICESYREAWKEKLLKCVATEAELELILDSMVLVCQLGCDFNNPFGASTVTPDHVNDPNIQFKSFNDVLKNLLKNPDNSTKSIYVPQICDALIISMPQDYGHNYFGNLNPFADTCACNKDYYNQPLFRATRSCPDTINTPNNNCPCTEAGSNKEALKVISAIQEHEDKYKCNTCISCEGFRNAFQSYFSDYDTFDLNLPKNQDFLNNYLNNFLKFNLRFSDYISFAASCAGFTSINLDSIFEINADTVFKVFGSIYMVYKGNSMLSYIQMENLPTYIPKFDEPTKINIIKTFYAKESFKFENDNVKFLASNTNYYPSGNWFINDFHNASISQTQEWITASNEVLLSPESKNYWPSEPIKFMGGKISLKPAKLLKVQKMMGGYTAPLPTGLDTCGCNKILSAQKLFNEGGSGASNASDLFSKMYNGNEKLLNFDSIQIICCRAANGNTSPINWQMEFDEPCQLPSNWRPGEWNKNNGSQPPITLDSALKKLGSDNPDLKLPNFFKCKNPCMTKIDTCACNKIALIYERYLIDSIDLFPKSFSEYFLDSVGGPIIPNIYGLLKGCNDAKNEGNGFNWDDNLSVENLLTFSNQDSLAMVPKIISCSEVNDCNPSGEDEIISKWHGGSEIFYNRGTSDQVDCSMILNILNEVKLATGLVSNPWGFTSNSTYRDSVLIRLNNAFDREPFKRKFDYDALYFAMRGECWCEFFPTKEECKKVFKNGLGIDNLNNKNGIISDNITFPIFPLTMQDSCGNCYMPTPLLGLLQQFLDTLTHDAITLSAGVPINKLTRNNWNLYPSYKRYFGTGLYTGSNASSLKYNITGFKSSEAMQFTLNDQNGNIRTVNLRFRIYNEKNNLQYIRKIYDIRPIAIPGCDTNITNFIVRAVMQRGGNYIPPTYDTLTLVGSVSPVWTLAKPAQSCEMLCLKLCNKPVALESKIKFDFNPCEERLKIEALRNANHSWERYKDSVTNYFKFAYYNKCLGANKNEVFELQYNERQYHYTLYYYDQAGNLIKTVPPAGVQFLSKIQTDSVSLIRDKKMATKIVPSHNLITHYRYNTLNQISWQKTPDGGISLFYYDGLGRMAISQNAKQKPGNYYSYTMYDGLGRISEVGELRNSAYINQDFLRSKENLETFLTGTFKRQITKTQYDNTSFSIVGKFEPENLRNRVSGSTYSENNSTGYDQAVYYSYDIHGNVKKLLRETPSLAEIEQDVKILTYDYDLASGKVNAVVYQEGEIDEYNHTYEYDNDMRLKRVYSGPETFVQELDAVYYYYMHGPLARTELGNLQVQGLDYAYTIQGWLKSVNGSTTHSYRDMGKDGSWDNSLNPNRQFAPDVFGFSLSYFEQDYSNAGIINPILNFEASTIGASLASNAPNLYNGNIRHMSVALLAFGNSPISYAYKYDQLNRIMEMNAYLTYDSASHIWQSSGDHISAYHNSFSYDANGNILTQLRNGKADTTDLDDLTYHYYSGTNRLKHVVDIVSSTNYSDDIDSQADSNYKYDPIGNLIQDLAEEIDTIIWNVYGKISKIKRTPSSIKPDLEFYYTPDGHRSVKVVIPKNAGEFKTYSYYVRDAQGNIMSIYNRTFDKVIYFDSLNYLSVNDSLMHYAGQTGFADFISNLHGTIIPNEDLDVNILTRLDSSIELSKELLYDIDPSTMLNSNPHMVSNLIGIYNSNTFLTAINGAGLVNMEDLLANLCYCLFERNALTGGPPATLLEWLTSGHSQAQAVLWMLSYFEHGEMVAILGQMGHSYSDMESAESFLSTASLKEFEDRLVSYGYDDCYKLKIALYSLLQNDVSKLIDLLSLHPDLKEMVAGTEFSSNCTSISSSELINSLVAYDRRALWDVLFDAVNVSEMIAYFKLSESTMFHYTVANQHPQWYGIYQNSHNLYSTTGTGMESYFGRIKDQFGQIFYDNLIAKFLNASKTYIDSFRLTEQVIYGSSRLGIYQNYKPLVGRYFNANQSQSSLNDQENISIILEPKSYALFTLYRGNKRYELSNHLGNVLTVITDKCILSCIGDTVSAKTADIVSATDYAPFGAPLAGRTFSSNGCRFGFNGQEKDDEVSGAGNTMTATFWEYDARLGRRWNLDPKPHTGVSDYSCFGDNPLINVDPNGDYFFGLFGSTSEQRRAANDFANATGGEVHKSWSKNINVTYKPLLTVCDEEYGVEVVAIRPMQTMHFTHGGELDYNGDGEVDLLKKFEYQATLKIGDYDIYSGYPKGSGALAAPTIDPIDLLAGVAGGLKGTAMSQRTDLFRAVSGGELKDISGNGIRNASGYESGKLFATTAQDAANFGKINYKFDNEPFTIIKTSISNKHSSSLFKGEMDLMPAVSVPKDLFKQLAKPKALNSTPLPNHPFAK